MGGTLHKAIAAVLGRSSLMGRAFSGQVFVIFILTVAAAEAALALALVVLLYRRRSTLNADDWMELCE